jgi:hypothetical protein
LNRKSANMKQHHREGLQKADEIACRDLVRFATLMHRRFEIARTIGS